MLAQVRLSECGVAHRFPQDSYSWVARGTPTSPRRPPGRINDCPMLLRYLTILSGRSIPSEVCGTCSWVSMKQTWTYQPGLAVILSCW